MPLSDPAVRNVMPAAKTKRLFDEKGLYLEVSPAGGKWWRLKYRFSGKEKRLSLGIYPDVSLKAARDRRDTARKLLADGVDPSENRKAEKAAATDRAANSFEVIAREWFANRKAKWVPAHADKIIRRLERDVFPWIGGRPIAEVTAPELLRVLRRIESRGAVETAHRALQNCGQVFRYGVATGRCDLDPSPSLRGALEPVVSAHYPTITDPTKVGQLLRDIDAYEGTFAVKCALRLAPLVFVRPGALRNAKWADIDFDKREWRPIEKGKVKHTVWLSDQALSILRELQPLTGRDTYVFAGRNPSKCISENTVNAALRRLGYDTKTDIVHHGFRAMARTILHEELGAQPDVIELQLAHRVPDRLGRAYNRTKFLKDRQTMLQTWADYLDRLKDGAKVIQLDAARR